jgi:hypothetical protein
MATASRFEPFAISVFAMPIAPLWCSIIVNHWRSNSAPDAAF